VFDEKRIHTGTEPTVVELNGIKAGVLVCEDVWIRSPRRRLARPEPRCFWSSTRRYEVEKQSQREQQIVRAGWRDPDSAGFRHLIGGQDELVFDGNSSS